MNNNTVKPNNPPASPTPDPTAQYILQSVITLFSKKPTLIPKSKDIIEYCLNELENLTTIEFYERYKLIRDIPNTSEILDVKTTTKETKYLISICKLIKKKYYSRRKMYFLFRENFRCRNWGRNTKWNERNFEGIVKSWK